LITEEVLKISIKTAVLQKRDWQPHLSFGIELPEKRNVLKSKGPAKKLLKKVAEQVKIFAAKAKGNLPEFQEQRHEDFEEDQRQSYRPGNDGGGEGITEGLIGG